MIDFVHITPFCISVHLKNGTVDEFRIVAYPQFGMVHFIGPKGEYPIAPYALYTSMPEDEPGGNDRATCTSVLSESPQGRTKNKCSTLQ